MKKIWLLSLISMLLLSCSENEISNKNPYLPSYPVNVDINMNLPSYSTLLYASNSIIYPNQGVKGLIVFNTGSGYVAFDAACPNHAPSTCVAMTIKGIEAICSCDDSSYSLFTGLGKEKYPLKQYRVEQNGNVLRVYN